jgi:23S rRNA (pseudouridine1915-N3)-methyltransferase
MQMTIAAIGRMKAGPERELAERYRDRVNKAGRRFGLSLTVREIPESRAASPAARKDQEAAALLAALPQGAVLIALDETGRNLDSRAFAQTLAKWRDDGVTDLVFAIGGADGLGLAVLEAAAQRLAFGTMTWPHQMVRLMAAEQAYRAVTILSGHPYHRD